jgi:periplasmic protein CpxP/Spy
MRATRFGVLLAALTVLAALVASPGCLAQAPPATAPIPPPASSASPSTSSPPAAVAAPAVAQPAPPRLSAQVEAAIDRRIETLRSQLGITAAQMPLWDAFAKAMRENAQGTDALFAQRAGAVATMSAVDNMHDYARIARAYADNTERLAAAFDSLYASLSETQRRAADTIFREQATAAAKQRR